jgi:hypothetical protein
VASRSLQARNHHLVFSFSLGLVQGLIGGPKQGAGGHLTSRSQIRNSDGYRDHARLVVGQRADLARSEHGTASRSPMIPEPTTVARRSAVPDPRRRAGVQSSPAHEDSFIMRTSGRGLRPFEAGDVFTVGGAEK